MDGSAFDRLAKAFSASGSRRGIMRLLSTLPSSVALAALLGDSPDASAKKQRQTDDDHGSSSRRHRRKAKHRHQTGNNKENRKGKQKGKGKRKDKGNGKKQCSKRTCPANACGDQPDGCGGMLACGCGGNQLCVDALCQACDVCPTVGACAFTTVEAAIAFNAPPQQTILVCPGEYTGDLSIDRTLTLIGAGEGEDPSVDTILQGTGVTSVMTITNNDQDVTLRHLRITGGSSGRGGGVNHAGRHLTMTACSVSGNAVSGNTFSSFGGGVFNGAGHTADLTDCTISDNECTGDASGAGIANQGTMTLTDCLVSGNAATGSNHFGGGGMINNATGTLTLNRTVVRQNHANQGGGILNTIGTLRAMNCNITGNTTEPADVAGSGAGIFSFGDGTFLDACSVTENTAPDSTIPGFFSEGGGLFNSAGTVQLANGTSIANNYAQVDPNCGGFGITLGEGCAP